MNKNEKIVSQATSVGNKQKQTEDRFFSYPILCPLCHLHQRKQIKMKFMQLRIYFNVACKMHIIVKKASTKHGHWIAQFYNTELKCLSNHELFEKKVSKALRQKLVEWIMENYNVCASTIEHDT